MNNKERLIEMKKAKDAASVIPSSALPSCSLLLVTFFRRVERRWGRLTSVLLHVVYSGELQRRLRSLRLLLLRRPVHRQLIQLHGDEVVVVWSDTWGGGG